MFYFPYNIFISWCSSQLCGSNAFNFVLNGAILSELFTVYYVTMNLTIIQSILTHFFSFKDSLGR
jgi:hypothetical protein